MWRGGTRLLAVVKAECTYHSIVHKLNINTTSMHRHALSTLRHIHVCPPNRDQKTPRRGAVHSAFLLDSIIRSDVVVGESIAVTVQVCRVNKAGIVLYSESAEYSMER